MLHRTTWFAIPILGLVLVGSSVGWWGYDQFKQRQALALQNENQYNANFHALVDNVQKLREELGKARISVDNTAFQSHLRNIWRLDYAAETEIGKLPFDLMPMHNTQTFLDVISHRTDDWLESNAGPGQSVVQSQLKGMYNQSGTVLEGLQSIQAKVLNNQVRWADVNNALLKNRGDNQVVDGFRKIDTATTAFVESQDSPSSLQRGKSLAMSSQRDVSGQTAVAAVKKFLRLPSNLKLQVKQTQSGAYRPEYVVTGNTALGPLTATVSADGGHVLSFMITHAAAPGDYDFATAADTAQNWLNQRGFGPLERIQSTQYDGVGYFVFAPKRSDGALVTSQGIAVRVALDVGSIIGFDANNYYYFPVSSVPPRKYTVAQLRAALSPNFHVEMAQSVVALDSHQQYQPAVAFYGTANGETYCVYVNANTGREMHIDQLT